MKLFTTEGKRVKGGVGSTFDVVTPKSDAINGGSPNLVLIDEMGLIPMLGRIMNEGRPTLFKYDQKTDKIVPTRQLIAWGTGGENEKANAVFESEWNAAKQAWKDKDYDYGIIPVMFDKWAREGITQDFLDKEQKRYYSKTGPDKLISRSQYHQHYPTTDEDMFISSSETLISIDEINAHLSRCYLIRENEKPRYGYFEPIYNTNQPNNEDQYLPYKLIGSRFRQTSGWDDPRTTSCIIMPYDSKWANRNFQGTDPVNSETGHSNMASSVWDAVEGGLAGFVNWRSDKPKEHYIQCMLLNIYYGQPVELLEMNIGSEYNEYNEVKKMDKRFMSNMLLPPHMQTPSKNIGIHNNAGTAKFIVTTMLEMILAYGENINAIEFWMQLKKFVKKTSQAGKSRYQAEDLRYHFDDLLFSTTFSYLCAVCNAHKKPIAQEDVQQKKSKPKRVLDKNFNLRLAYTDKNGNVIKYVS